MLTDLDKGVRVSGAVVNIAAVGAANATAIFTRSAFAQQVGTKSFIPRKLMVRNNAGGNLWLSLGTGVGGLFADALPPVRVLNNMDGEWQEFDLPSVELFANMTAFPDALVAGGSVDVQVEVEERG
ncbi:MAG: hypothetical protein PHU23_00150 [Dehalococcoidales bacterium]|jgi:hypothetical protein|nr:hypothetical protein [Dehalococcoidales bacterium]